MRRSKADLLKALQEDIDRHKSGEFEQLGKDFDDFALEHNPHLKLTLTQKESVDGYRRKSKKSILVSTERTDT